MNLFMFIAHFHFMIMAEGSLRGVTLYRLCVAIYIYRLMSQNFVSTISLRQRTKFPYIYVVQRAHTCRPTQYNP